MRVLHITPYFSPAYGGPTVAVAQMVKAVVRLGVEVDVVTTTANGDNELDIPIGDFVDIDGVRCIFFRRSILKSWMWSRGLMRWLDRNISDYDVVHIHGMFTFPGLVGCVFCRKYSIPYVISPHGMLDKRCFSEKLWKKFPYFYLFEKRNFDSAAIIHVTSRLEAESIARFGYRNSIKLSPLCAEIVSHEQVSYSESSAFKIVFVSRLVPIKGLEVLFDAVALLASRNVAIRLDVVGSGDDAYVDTLMRRVSVLRLNESVFFHGHLNGVEKNEVLFGADVFVLPSYHENFSLSTVEAMGIGLPVIISDQVGIVDDVRAARAGYDFPAGSVSLLARAIERLTSVHERRQTGANARELVIGKFSQELVGNYLFGFYSDLI